MFKGFQIFILIFLFFPFNVWSGSSVLRNYTMDDGIPGNAVYSIQQDSKGYIWICTERGVAKYDGKNFKNYSTDDGLSENEIFQIYEDNSGRIWFFGFNGKLSFYQNDFIYNQEQIPILRKINPKGMGVQMIQDSLNNLWYVTSSIVWKYSFKENKLDSLTLDQFTDSRFLGIAFHEGIPYVLSRQGIVNWNDKQIYHHEEIRNARFILNSKMLYYNGRIFAGSNNSVLSFEPDMKNINIKTEYVFEGNIQNILKINDTLVWVATANGAYKYNVRKNKIEHSYLKSESVSWISTDRENITWFGTLESGIFYSLNPEVQVLGPEQGLAYKRAFSLAKLPDGKIVVGHERLKASVIEDDTIIALDFNNHSLNRSRIYSIYIEDKDHFWLVSEKSILIDISGKEITHQVIPYGSKILSDGPDENKMYVAGSQGLSVFERKHLFKPKEKLGKYAEIISPGIRIYAMYYDTVSGRLLTGGTSGLQWLDTSAKELKDVIVNGTTFKKQITKIIPYNERALAVSSSLDGIYIIEGNRTFHFSKADGLSSGICYSVHKDSIGNLWAATAKGLNKISFEKNKFSNFSITHFGEEHGLVSNKILDVVTNGDRIYVATTEGVCSFREADVVRNNIPPLLHLKESTASGTVLDPGTKTTLPYLNNHLQFSFNGVSFRSGKNLMYRYKMEGIDKGWNETYSEEIEYPYLRPGDYRFLLSAINSDGITATDPIVIEFTILKPFYRTWWFYTLGVILFVLVIAALIYLWFRNIAEKHSTHQTTLLLERDKAETERKMIELEHMALRLHMNPHFVFNAINAIQGFYAANEIPRAKSYISKFSKLMRSILDTSREPHVPLEEEIDLIKNYLELCALRMEYPFSYEINLDKGLDLATNEIAPMLVQPFVENAILHGIAPLKGGGHISISFNKKANHLECVIEDNGIGREKSRRLNHGKLHKSSGIKVTEERISLINQSVAIDSFVEITDLYDENKNPEGTRICFRTRLFSDQD